MEGSRNPPAAALRARDRLRAVLRAAAMPPGERASCPTGPPCMADIGQARH